ncbi:MAG: response regulator [Candidatus Rokubacteria bacterium]|nr:response regulator [Candidatus Rokubacteria bacterium]
MSAALARRPEGGDPEVTKRRVLIVDDERTIAETLAECVGPDYRVELASDGTQALAAVRRERPDVILLDVNMPGLTGVEVLQRVRAMDASIPVIMITATPDYGAVTEALALGAFSYIPKPFSVKYVQNLVSAAVTGGRR